MQSTSEQTIALVQPGKLVPLLHIEDLDNAVPLAQTLVECGLPVMEVGLRTQVAARAISLILDKVPGAIPIAGNIMSASDLSRAQQAGAKVASSPASPPEVLEKAAKENFPFIPGIATPTELLSAVRSGFHLVKFFPAVPFGGAAALRAFEAPFPHVKFIPTGGTSEAEFDDWLKMANVIAVGGAWLAPREEIERKDFETIGSRGRYMVAKFQSLRSASG